MTEYRSIGENLSTVRRGRHGHPRRTALSVFLLLLGLITLGIPITSAQATGVSYYVAPTGSDSNPGTLGKPFKTVEKGLRTVRAGDTLLLRGGIYSERIRSVNMAPGSISAPITVRAYADERPVIRGLLWLRNTSYWDISGLTVEWSTASSKSEHMVKLTGGTGWNFSGNTLTGARSYAALLVTGGASDWKVTGNRITDTKSANNVNQDHLIYVNGTGFGVVERNVLLDSPNGRAVKIMDTPNGLLVRYNTMERNTGPSNVQLSGVVRNVVIERNVMTYSKDKRAAVTVHGYTGTNNVVRNNVVWRVAAATEQPAGLTDGGGNILADPTGFLGTYGAAAQVGTTGTPSPSPSASPSASPSPSPSPSALPITLRGTSSTTGLDSRVVVGRPAGTVSGDLIVVTLHVRGGSEVGSPHGWNEVLNTRLSTTARLVTYAKAASAAEPSSYAFEIAKQQTYVAVAAAYANVDGAAPFGATTAWSSQTPTKSGTVPSVTTKAAQTMLLVFGSTTTSTSISWPAGLGRVVDVASGAHSYRGTLSLAHVTQPSAGTTAATTYEAALSAYPVTHVVALTPSQR